DVDQHGAGAAGGRDVERFVDHARQLVDVGDQVAVLGDGAGGADDVGFLEGIAPDLSAGDLAGDGDHRHRVHVCGREPGDEVQRAGRRGGEHNTRFAAGAGVAVGHVRRALLVPHEDVLELGVIRQVLVDGQVGAAGVAEYQFD